MQITKNWRKCLLRYILFIQYKGYVRKMKRGKAFMVCGWLLYCLGFLCLHKLHHCCISLFIQLDIVLFIVSAFGYTGADSIRYKSSV